MPQITKITTQKKRADRFNIFMDYGKGEEYAFSVDEDVLLKYQLKKGMELDELDLSEIQFHDDIQKTVSMALNYLSHRMRSENEVRTYLEQKEVEAPIIQEAIHKLYQYKYLDDLAFGEAFVRTHMNGGKKGPIILRRELKDKGLNDIQIEQALLQYPYDIQVEHAKILAEKMIVKEKNTSANLLKQKIEQSLYRKGFSSDAIANAMQDIVIEKPEGDEWHALSIQAEKVSRRLNKYSDYEYRHKMKQALFRKGFQIDLIERYLDRHEN
ncbi:recombination regulator RecX [Peribacillus sp. SCS-155]|uniref:recombination regulator RecX n=1 Tax=Peribacillus sedimenti TaxID=3115297 RepID=UPI003905B8B7